MASLTMAPAERPFHGTERFAVVQRIGAGGMGVVYEAFDRERQERVALKTLREFDGSALYRFKQEFRTVSEILHPHLVPLYELVGEGDRWFFTMEFVEGAVDLLTYLRGRVDDGGGETSSSASTIGGPDSHETGRDLVEGSSTEVQAPTREPDPRRTVTLDFSRIRDVFRQLATGVGVVHAAGKLHRDLKPSNVLVTPQGRVVILDFGLVANLAEAAADRLDPPGDSPGQRGVYHSTENALMGTVAFMSPEQAARAPLTPASDWYAVGVMLFQVLTGRLPFDVPAVDVLVRKQQIDGPAPSEIVADIPSDLDALALALMRRDPDRRPSAAEILSILGTAANSAAIDVVPDVFVGRATHLRALADCYGDMRAGNTVVCHVSGASGAGKSTLLSKFLGGLAGTEAVVLHGRCYEQESVPYKALDSLIDSLAQYLSTLDRDDVRAMLPPHVAELTRVFPVLARVPALADSRASSPVGSDLRSVREYAFAALRAWFGELSRTRRLVLCIDDLQWGDLDSAALIADLVKGPGAPPLLMLLSYRSEYLDSSPCLRALQPTQPDVHDHVERRIDVDVLTPEDTRSLAEALLGAFSDPSARQDAIEWVVRESGGRPFFVGELVAHLQSGAAVRNRPDLDEVLWDRVTRLPDVSRRLLEVIAVAGRPVQVRDAQTAALLPALPPDVVAGLRAARLVRTTGRTLHDQIETFHDRIRESITGHLAPGDRRRYHAALAVTLERAGHADAETLAAHFEGADEPARASGCYAQAATEAVQVLAFERAETLFRRAVSLAATHQDRARIQERMIHFYTDTARFGDAYATARTAVEPFGIRLPAKFVPPLFVLDFVESRIRLRGKTAADLLALPLATDQELDAAIRLMNAVAKAAYQIRPELCVAVATKIVNLCLRHGNTRDCAIGYLVFGAIFRGGVLGNHRFGYEFGRLALSLVERYRNEQQRAEVHFVVGYFGTSWLRPVVEAEALWKIAYDAGLQTGDLFHTGCACAGTAMSHFMRGVPLSQMWDESEPVLKVLRQHRLHEPIGVVTAIRQAIRNLRGDTADIDTLDGDGFDEAAFVQDLATYGSRHFAHMYFIVKTQVLYLQGRYEAAIEVASQSAAYRKDSPGMLHIADHYFYQALTHAELRRSPRLVARAARQFRRWAAECPDNFLHKCQVLEAEMKRMSGRATEAAAIHARAAETARQYGYVHIEGLAAMLESRALVAADRPADAERAAARADDAFRRWGATSLVRDRSARAR
jgi:serine/threonine protein kinase/predicted ATPase